MDYHDLKSKFIEVAEGVKINCRYNTSKGKSIIFLHGFPEFGFGWRNQIPAFADEYQIIVPDLRGYHLSSKPKGVKAYSLENLVGDILAIMDDFGLEKATIVAHDWGGGIAWTLTSLFPERVEKLIILNMPHPDELKRQLRQNFKQLRRSYYAILFQIPLLPELFFHAFPNWFFRTVFKKRSLRPEVFSDSDLKVYQKAFSSLETWTATINYYRAFFRYPAPKLKEISVPTGMIWGEQDFALGKELTLDMEKYCSQFLGVSYIPGASHWLQHEYVEEVNGYIRRYLEMKG